MLRTIEGTMFIKFWDFFHVLQIVCKLIVLYIYFFPNFPWATFIFYKNSGPYIKYWLRSQDFFWVRIYKWNKANPEKLISKGQYLSTIFTDQLLKNNKIRDFRDSCIRMKKSRISVMVYYRTECKMGPKPVWNRF